MSEKQEQREQDWMIAEAEVVERPFTSTTPLIGSLLARFRSGWNSIATKWYVRPLLAQQNQFNRLVAERFGEQDGRLIAQDRQQTQHSHDLAEITALLTQINRQLAELDQRLTTLELQSSDQ